LHPYKLKAFPQTQRPFFHTPQTQSPFFHTPQTFNESKNSLPHTFTLKLDTFKNLKNKFFTLEKNLQSFKEISSTPFIHLEMIFYSFCNLAN